MRGTLYAWGCAEQAVLGCRLANPNPDPDSNPDPNPSPSPSPNPNPSPSPNPTPTPTPTPSPNQELKPPLRALLAATLPLLTLALVALRLDGVTARSWWLILAPLWPLLALAVDAVQR